MKPLIKKMLTHILLLVIGFLWVEAVWGAFVFMGQSMYALQDSFLDVILVVFGGCAFFMLTLFSINYIVLNSKTSYKYIFSFLFFPVVISAFKYYLIANLKMGS